MSYLLRALASLVSIAGFAALIYLNQGTSEQITEPEFAKYQVSTEALPLTIFCPGALTELGGKDGTEISSLTLVGSAEIFSHVGGAELAQEIPNQIESGTKLELKSKEQTTAALSAIQIQIAKRQRMQGLAAINCSQPVTSGLFATGMASVGRESILKLANPGISEVQIFLKFALSTGERSLTLTLAPGEIKDLSLAPYVDAEPNFAVSFTTSGPAVSAVMQLRTSSGLATTGVDLVPATNSASQLWIPGLQVFADGFSAPKLRVYNPSDQDQIALITLHGVGVDSDVFEVTVPSGLVIEKDLNLAVGDYLVEISSVAELGAAIWSQRVSDNLDFAWLTPANSFSDAVSIPVPQLPAELVIANPQSQAISVSLQNAGQFSSVTIAGKSSVRLPVSYPLAQVQSANPFMVQLQLLANAGFASVAPVENLNLGSDLEISVR